MHCWGYLHQNFKKKTNFIVALNLTILTETIEAWFLWNFEEHLSLHSGLKSWILKMNNPKKLFLAFSTSNSLLIKKFSQNQDIFNIFLKIKVLTIHKMFHDALILPCGIFKACFGHRVVERARQALKSCGKLVKISWSPSIFLRREFIFPKNHPIPMIGSNSSVS